MPIYEYSCKSCGHQFEELVRGDEKPACPACGKKQLERQWSVPAAHAANNASGCPAKSDCAMSQHCCGPSCCHGH